MIISWGRNAPIQTLEANVANLKVQYEVKNLGVYEFECKSVNKKEIPLGKDVSIEYVQMDLTCATQAVIVEVIVTPRACPSEKNIILTIGARHTTFMEAEKYGFCRKI